MKRIYQEEKIEVHSYGKTEPGREYIILDSVMSGYIEMLLQLLDSDTVSMEEAFHFAYYTMENGTRPALRKRFGIT